MAAGAHLIIPRRVDVAIVGGGLAGSTLAMLLATRGLAVALLDRDEFPRDKLCGEFLSYDALPVLDRVGILAKIDDAGASRIRRCRVVGRRRTLEFDFPKAARGISRMRLDDLMFREAGSAGAVLLPAHTVTAMDDSSITAGSAELGTVTIEARVVVGAWGRWGRFDTQFGRSFVRDRSHRHFGFKRHYRRVTGTSEGTIDLYSFQSGYLGVNDIEGGETNICGLVHADRLAGHRGKWDTFVGNLSDEGPHLRKLFAEHEPAQQGFLSSEPVIFRPRSVVEQGVFLIGDASGVLDPLTGNGMAMAIQSALLAAPSVVDALTGPAGAAERYRTEHADFFRPRIRWSRRIAPLLSHPLLMDAALTLLPIPAAGRLLLERTRAEPRRLEALAARWFC